ncbi:MAG TPA: AAA family ATPase [Acidimicrobiales bacterium]|nr:AAA family ATPase [Acidimicrobiales bacterium]
MDDFVGRELELRELEAQLHSVRKGEPRVVVLEGGEGIGKSALLREVLAHTQGFSVVHASGDQAEAELPCGVAGQLLASAGTRPSTEEVFGQDPLLVGGRLLRLVEELETRGPVIVVVDDAQWADRASLQALSFALRRLNADPVLGVVAARNAATALPDGLRRLAQERGTVLRLDGLSVDELGQLGICLGAGPLPRRALQRLRDHSGGNPLHARALLEELPPEALSRVEVPLPAPRSFALLVLSRLAACSRDARTLVEAASVLGLQADLGLVCRVAGIVEPAGALDEAVAGNLLDVRETPTSLVVAFPHSMVRAAVYDGLSRAARSAYHTRAGELVRGPLSLRHRAAAALLPDPALAAELVGAARRERTQGRPAAAGRWLLAAARLEAHRRSGDEHLLEGVELLLTAGEVAEASALGDALRDTADTARRGYVLGHLALLSGRQHEAERLLQGAWSDGDPVREAELRSLAAEQLAELCALQVRPEDAIAWARRAVDAAPDSSTGSSALTTLVVSLALTGKPGEALPLVESLPEDPSSPTPCDQAGMLARGIVRSWIAELDQSHADLSAVLEASQRALGSRTGLMALGHLAQVEYVRGKWADSVRHAELAVALAADSGQAWLLPMLHATASWPLSARGAWEAAEEHVRAAKVAAADVGDTISIAHADDAEVRLAFCRQDHERALAATERLLSMPGREVVDEPAVFAWRELHPEALVAVSRLDEATRALAALEDKLAARPRRRLARANAARVRANLEAARSNDARARKAFAAGFALLESIPAPFERALLEDAHGRFLRRLGERRSAAGRLDAAREAYAELGARPFLERAERELAACGLRPRPRNSSAAVRLTPQELAVAQLVAEGRTNREVSEALMVSQKTVEYHLSHVFAKLGVSRRREVRERLVAGGS